MKVRTHLTCDCAPGFATVCAPTDDGLSLCTCTSTNLVSDSLYGGMYALDALTHQCATVNPITLQCACPSWTTPAKPIPTQHSTIVICSADKFAMPAPSYGGRVCMQQPQRHPLNVLLSFLYILLRILDIIKHIGLSLAQPTDRHVWLSGRSDRLRLDLLSLFVPVGSFVGERHTDCVPHTTGVRWSGSADERTRR